MSSFSAALRLEGAAHSVLTCDYLFYQHTDDSGNAVSRVRSGEITLLLEASDDVQLLELAANPLRPFDGEVVFFRTDQPGGVAELLAFKNASCVSHVEQFEPDHPVSAYLLEVKIVADELTLNYVPHANNWHGHS